MRQASEKLDHHVSRRTKRISNHAILIPTLLWCWEKRGPSLELEGRKGDMVGTHYVSPSDIFLPV